MNLVKTGRLNLGQLITHRFALDEIEEAYFLFSRRTASSRSRCPRDAPLSGSGGVAVEPAVALAAGVADRGPTRIAS
jgi:hypothetical protein